MSPAFMAGLGGASLIAMYNYLSRYSICFVFATSGCTFALCGLEVLAGRR
jgi:hypothetical protein